MLESLDQEWLDVHAATDLLGVTQPKFFYHVERGEIAIEPGSTRKLRRYKRADILAVKARITGKKVRKGKGPLIDWFYTSDLPAGLRLLQQLYTDDVNLADFAVYQTWWRNNNRTTMSAFSHDRKECYASVQVLPLAESLIYDLLSGRRAEASIGGDDIRSYDDPGPYSLLVTSAACLPTMPALLYEILYKYIQFWIEQYPERYATRVYAQAVSERGDLLIQHFFMTPRYDLAHNAYMLDLARPGASKMVRHFQQQLIAKATLPAALQPNYDSPAARQEPIEMPISPSDRSTDHKSRIPTSRTTQPLAGTRPTLPGGWASWTQFIQRHSIDVDRRPLRTINRADYCQSTEYMQPNVKGTGSVLVKCALDLSAQKRLLETLQGMEIGKELKPCEVENCPCKEILVT